MSNLVEGTTGGAGGVNLGGGHVVSMQVLQQVYREFTGKSERITKQFSVNHKTDFADLENLNAKIEQLLEQYHIREKVCTVTFFRSDDYSERFSSFDRARAYDGGATTPIENVRLEYDFLIVLPIVNKPQPFKVTVDVHSVATMLEKLREGPHIQRRLATAFATTSGGLTVEYVDYAVARTMIGAVSQWFDALESSPPSALLKGAKKISHHFGWIFRCATASITALAFGLQLIWSPISDLSAALLYGIAAFSSIFVFSAIAYQLGDYLEVLLDEYQCVSYLNLNKGDARLIERVAKQRKTRLVLGGLSIAGAILINLFATWLAKLLGMSP